MEKLDEKNIPRQSATFQWELVQTLQKKNTHVSKVLRRYFFSALQEGLQCLGYLFQRYLTVNQKRFLGNFVRLNEKHNRV